jgi:putative FmdB family regulatory protein
MPIYEYRCGKCGDFETMQKMSDKPLTTCPTCRRKVTKLISSTSFQLKGSGWYVTDYARKGSSGSESKGPSSTKTDEGAAKSGETKSGETKSTETKSAETKTTSTSKSKNGSAKAAAA